MHSFIGARRSGLRLFAILTSTAPAALLSLTASAQEAASSSSNSSSQQGLQEVVVTGSLIKRTDLETPSPVQLISEDQLKNSGFTQVSDVLRNLSANGAGTLSQGFGQAFASGASGIALRGLTVGDTLTLIDGERMVSYPLADDGERSFVDVTAIPFNAIETVEVLKDGASAIYGADAIAGVVNIKLKPTYTGAQFTAEGGASQQNDGWTWHASGIVGFGDLNSDGYNLYMALDWHRQGLIWGSSRSGAWTNLNWSGLPGGVNTTPGAPGAQGLTYPDSVTGYTISPTTGGVLGYLPGCNAAAQAAAQCTFSFPGQIQPPTEQTNFLAKFTKQLASDWQFVTTASIFSSVAQQTAPPTEPAFGHLLQNSGAEQGSLPLIAWGPSIPIHVNTYPVLSLPANSPYNPVPGTANELVYSFPDIGPWVVNTDTQTYRLFGELKGSAAGWDLDAAVGIMYAKMSLNFDGGLIPAAMQTALNNGSYVPGADNNNIADVAPVASSQPTSTLDLIDVHGTHDLFQMPGGPLSLAVGAQYFHKAVNDQDPPLIAQGIQEGITNFTIGSQDDTSGFLEVSGKPIHQIELDAAVRYDHYDTYGGSATPKFGIKVTPIEMLTLRGTWGKGFRAPSISEAGNSGIAFGLGNSSDSVLCANGVNHVGSFNYYCSYPITGVEPGNPDLKAVTSTNATMGVIFEPIREFNVSVDWYRIQLNNDILSATTGGLSNFSSLVRGAQTLAAVCTATVTTGTCPQSTVLTPVGAPVYLNFPYLNAGSTRTSGIDIELQSKFDLGNFGKLTGQIDYTYISQYEITVAGVTYDVAGTHGPSGVSGDTGNPKQRAVASLTWDQGPFSTTLTANYIGSFKVTDPSTGWFTCLQALSTSGVAYGAAIAGVTTLPSAWNQYCSVNHFTSFNLAAHYALTDHVQVHGSITNLFNSQPPVDLETYGGGAAYRYTTMEQDGAIGRFFLLGATLTF